jgi:ribosomal protein S18 acetylase RimI-like enzyme
MIDLAIRDAVRDDAEALARLVTDLGYPTSPGQMQARLDSIFADADYRTLVAIDDGMIVGFIGLRIGLNYASDGLYGQIMAFSVAPGHQRRGVGSVLLEAGEAALAARGAETVVVTTANHRADAHAFYEKNGYTFTGRRYVKAATKS